MTVYVSTGGCRGLTAHAAANELAGVGINAIELSGGRYASDLIERLGELRGRVMFQVHNYFPPPEHPFVLNLGSLHPKVASLSIAHVERAIEVCVALGANSYSFHAGFLIDPRTDELGQRIARRTLASRDESISAFVARVTSAAAAARSAGVRLMIENNVLSARNLSEFGTNPLLMCDPDGVAEIMRQMPPDVGFLVDVAHLKVSANSLGFDPARMFRECEPWIAGYHLSDNGGFDDSNDPFDDAAWFWPHLNPNVDYCSIEVYGKSARELASLVELTRSRLTERNPTSWGNL